MHSAAEEKPDLVDRARAAVRREFGTTFCFVLYYVSFICFQMKFMRGVSSFILVSFLILIRSRESKLHLSGDVGVKDTLIVQFTIANTVLHERESRYRNTRKKAAQAASGTKYDQFTSLEPLTKALSGK